MTLISENISTFSFSFSKTKLTAFFKNILDGELRKLEDEDIEERERDESKLLEKVKMGKMEVVALCL